jgi:hypothetical protein
MPRKRSPLVPIVLAAIAVGGAIVWLRRPQVVTDEPLAACPARAFLVARADVAALRGTALGDSVEPLLRALVPFPRTVADACGFEPVTRVESLALVVPEREDQSDIGIALKLRTTADELSHCAQGLGNSAPKPAEMRGAFTLFATGDGRADALAAAPNGLTILAPRAWATAMVDTANGGSPSATAAPPHAELLRAAARADGHPRSVVVSIALPTATRVRLRQELEREGDAGTKETADTMAGVLGVEAVAAAIDVSEKTELALELRCETERACNSVKELLERKQRAWSENTIVQILGLGRAAAGMSIALTPRRIALKTSIDTPELRGALERILSWRRASRAPKPALAAPSGNDDAK